MNMTSENYDLYEVKMALFDNGDLVELFLFISNFDTNLKASGTLKSSAKIQYLCMLVRGKALRQFGALTAEVGSATPENLTPIILVLGT